METNRPLPISAQITVLNCARLLLEADRSENLPYADGLCSYLRKSLVDYKNRERFLNWITNELTKQQQFIKTR